MNVQILSNCKSGVVPSWMGGRFSISPDLGVAIRHSFSHIQKKCGKSLEIEFLDPLFKEQEWRSELPQEDELLVEYIHTRYGYHLFVYPFDWKLVHEGVAQVLAYRLGKMQPVTFEDYDPQNLLFRQAYDEVFDFQYFRNLFGKDTVMTIGRASLINNFYSC